MDAHLNQDLIRGRDAHLALSGYCAFGVRNLLYLRAVQGVLG